MNTWQPRTASCALRSRVGCNCQTERNPLWLRLPAGWDARLWPKSPWSLGPIPFCAGFASWWRASLMVRDCDRPWGDRGSTPAIENLIVRVARENPAWGYDRIVGALTNLGHTVSDQTVGNILKRHGIAPAPRRKHCRSSKCHSPEESTGSTWVHSGERCRSSKIKRWFRLPSRWSPTFAPSSFRVTSSLWKPLLFGSK
jgi:hypothetical protein